MATMVNSDGPVIRLAFNIGMQVRVGKWGPTLFIFRDMKRRSTGGEMVEYQRGVYITEWTWNNLLSVKARVNEAIEDVRREGGEWSYSLSKHR